MHQLSNTTLPKNQKTSFYEPVYFSSTQSKLESSFYENCAEEGNEEGDVLLKEICKQLSEKLSSNFSKDQKFLFLAGKGGNGADALKTAELLLSKGYRAEILTPETPLKALAHRMYESLTEKFKMPQLLIHKTQQSIERFDDYDVIVDGVYGAGFKGSLDENTSHLLKKIHITRKASSTFIAIDIPSGIHADSMFYSEPTTSPKAPKSLGPCPAHPLGSVDTVYAAGLYKPFHVSEYGHKIFKTLEILPFESEILPTNKNSVEKSDLVKLNPEHLHLPPREKTAHKFEMGHTLVLGGSSGMMGSVCLAAHAALYSGSGLVSVLIPKNAGAEHFKFSPSIMVKTLSHSEKALSVSSFDEISQFISERKVTAIAAGMGAGAKPETTELIAKLLEHINVPTVIDADGLRAVQLIRKKRSSISLNPDELILTPHPGEWKKHFALDLPGCPTDIQSESSALRCTIIYKNSCPLVTRPEASPRVLANPQNSLAVAGSGDVLSGIAASFLAQPSIENRKAAELSICLHNLAGKFSLETQNSYSCTSEDLLEGIREILKNI